MDSHGTVCITFEVVILPLIFFASEVEAKECVKTLCFKSIADNCSVSQEGNPKLGLLSKWLWVIAVGDGLLFYGKDKI